MGDGSTYTVEASSERVFMPIRYYNTRDINVSTLTAAALKYTVERQGDIYHLDAITGNNLKTI